jgi:Transglycosylase-like domain
MNTRKAFIAILTFAFAGIGLLATTAAMAAPAAHAAPTRTVRAGDSGPSGFQACVAYRESGDGVSSSDIYGFLPSTWASLGLPGSPYTASPAQQDAAFQMLYARDGSAPWAPYDGC